MEKDAVLGILATRGVNRPASARDPFPGRTRTFWEISKIGRELGVGVCAFSPRHINRRRKVVQAWVFEPRRGWVQRVCALPPVVYNRVANRRAESHPRVQALLEWLKKEGIVVFNPRFLDKWDVYDTLQADEAMRERVPETVLYTASGQVVDALRRWGVVYCKPRRGSLGKGITAFRLSSGSRVMVQHNRGLAGTDVMHLASTSAAARWAGRHLRPYAYCLQKGISLAKAQGRRYDIRALVQKDGEGEWRFTGAAARLAGRGQLTTHVPRGGSRLALRSALRASLRDKDRAQLVEEELAALSEAAAASLERAKDELYGEFSLDVGLDNEGQLWILEINAKPFRFDEIQIRRRAYRRLIEFSRFLQTAANDY